MIQGAYWSGSVPSRFGLGGVVANTTNGIRRVVPGLSVEDVARTRNLELLEITRPLYDGLYEYLKRATVLGRTPS